MSGEGDNNRDQLDPKQPEHRGFRSYVWGIGLELLVILVPIALMRWADMYEQGDNGKNQLELKQQERHDFRSYVWGFGLGLLLTLLPFALVYWPEIPRSPLLIVIGVFALAQMLVHLRFFLHIGFKQKREDLHLILFSALILIIMVAGTIWIMASLALRMTMPASP